MQGPPKKSLRFPYDFWLGVAFLLAGSLLVLWLCPYSIDLTDEAYSIIPGWKLLPLGERPFQYEIYNAPRHHDLLNYLLIQPWVPYSVLTIRRIASLLFVAQIVFLCAVAFRYHFGLLAGLAGLACLTFANVTLPFSYNTWARGMLCVHQATLLLAFRSGKKYWPFAAGLSLGIATVAYAPLGLVFPVCLLTLAALRDPRFNWRRLIEYATGFALPTLGDALSIWYQGAWPTLRQDLHALTSLPDYSRSGHLFHYLRWLTDTPEFWLFGLLFFFKHRIVWGLVAIDLVIRFHFLGNGIETTRTWNALVMAGTIALAFRDKLPELFPLLAAGVTALLVFVHFSASGIDSAVWALPALFLPVISKLTEQKTTHWLVAVFLAALIIGGVRSSLHFRMDVPRTEMTATLTTPPLEGLKTSPRRAELVEKLAEAVAHKRYILAYPFLAGGYYFGEAKPAVKTLATQPGDSVQSRLEALRWMVMQKERMPELIIRARRHAWDWGTSRGEPFHTPAVDPFFLLSRCAKAKMLVDEPEVEAMEIDPTAFRVCLEKLNIFHE